MATKSEKPAAAEPANVDATENYAQTPVNSQVLATIDALQNMAATDSGALCRAARDYARSAAQSMALQDAVSHLRRTQILAETANAIGLAKIANKETDVGQAVIDAAQGAVAAAQAGVAEAEKALKN